MIVDGCDNTFHYPVEFSMVVLVFAIAQAAIGAFRHHAVAIPYVRNVESRATCGEVGGSVHSDKAFSLVAVAFSDNKHFAEVNFFAGLAKNLVFQKSICRETPAGAALVLVSNRGCLDKFNVSKFESCRIRNDNFVVAGGRCADHCRRSCNH